jgi:hypothetical protein
VNVLFGLPFLFVLAISTWAQADTTSLPRFEDYPVTDSFTGTPVPPKLTTKPARLYRTRIHEGVDKGWGVNRDGREQGRPGPNFAGNMIIVQWSSGAPGMEMAMVNARTGEVYFPPISFHGVGAASFDLPLLTPGSSVSRNPEVQFRLDSRLMVITATPKQTQRHPSYSYYFLWQDNAWTLIKRLPLKVERPYCSMVPWGQRCHMVGKTGISETQRCTQTSF